MIIGVDIGNTTVEIGFVKNLKNIISYRLKTDYQRTSDDWYLNINHLFSIEKLSNRDIDLILISSVVPVVEKRIFDAFDKIHNKRPLIIGKDVNIPIVNKYHKPEEVGVDRLVNSLAVLKQYGYPSIIVDLGTAITFDIINRKGEYEGGAIFPGIDASISALFSKTAKLPAVNLELIENPIGKNTADSIKSGIYFGYLSLIEGMIERINKYENTTHKVIITGGNGKLFADGIEMQSIFDDKLSMKGLYFLYQDLS